MKLVDAPGAAEAQPLSTQLLNQTLPAVELGLQTMRGLQTDDSPHQKAILSAIATGWQQFKSFWASNGLVPPDAAGRAQDLAHLDGLFGPMESGAEALAGTEDAQAQAAYHRALRNYQTTVWVMRALLLAGLALSAAVMVWLVRGILPRTTAYGRFPSGWPRATTAPPPRSGGTTRSGAWATHWPAWRPGSAPPGSTRPRRSSSATTCR